MRFCYAKPEVPTYGGHLRMGSDAAKKNGTHIFDVNNKYMTLDGKPFYLLMAEMHFSRYDRRDWEREILKMKACGINTVATYLFWIHHEEKEGVFDFSGDRDIRTFVSLCQKHGLYVWLRPGPWCHGEARHGGFPDWLMEKNIPLRTNNEDYLFYVERLYAAYAEQVKGLYWKDGGPVIGIQLDNELTNNAPHLTKLKKIALAHGMDVPYFSITGWYGYGIAEFEADEVLPMFGSYTDFPWESCLTPIEGTPCVLPTPGRTDGTIGTDQILGGSRSAAEDELEDYPFLTCETGPGIQITHHRRPIIQPMDVYVNAMMTAAKGANGIGYYVFHGGRNPRGGLYQESKDSDYPNDLPVSSYDFQAPLSEYGHIHPCYNYFRLLHEFIDFGSERFARSEAFFSDEPMTSRMDVKTPRAVLRALPDGEGWLFVNTHQRTLPLEPLSAFTAELDSGKSVQVFPRTPIDIPSGIMAAFPLNFVCGGRRFDYATVQPVSEIVCGDRKIRFYTAFDGVRSEFAFSGGDVLSVMPSREKAFSVGDTDVFVLSFADALRFCRFGDRVWLTERGMYEENGTVKEYGIWGKMPTLSFDADTLRFIPLDSPAFADIDRSGIRLVRQPACHYAEGDNIYLRYLYSAPSDCVEYSLEIPKDILDDCDDIRLRLAVHGDVGMIFCGNDLLADFYAAGEETVIGLARFRDEIRGGKPLTLVLSPLAGKHIYLERYLNFDLTEAVISGIDVMREVTRRF